MDGLGAAKVLLSQEHRPNVAYKLRLISMMDVRRTELFDDWLRRLNDERAQAKIAARIDRLALCDAGDVKAVGSGVSEMRVDYGPGYRVCFLKKGKVVIVLLAGGDTSTQCKDIRAALDVARAL